MRKTPADTAASLFWLSSELLRNGHRAQAFAVWVDLERAIAQISDPTVFLALTLRAERFYERFMLAA